MAKNNITQYDATAANNTDIDSINIDEGMAASDVNNALRSLMSHLKNVDTGSQALTALSVTGATTSGTLKVSDGGTIGSASDADAMTISSGGVVTFSQNPIGAFISEADMFRLTANTGAVDPVSSNLERVDDASFSKIGTGMSVNSGIFSFPRTGLYLVRVNALGQAINSDNIEVDVYATQDNSSYDIIAVCVGSGDDDVGTTSMSAESFVNVTDTSNVKVKFGFSSIDSGSAIQGVTAYNVTSFQFIRLGESQ